MERRLRSFPYSTSLYGYFGIFFSFLLSYITNITLIHLYIYGYSTLFLWQVRETYLWIFKIIRNFIYSLLALRFIFDFLVENVNHLPLNLKNYNNLSIRHWSVGLKFIKFYGASFSKGKTMNPKSLQKWKSLEHECMMHSTISPLNETRRKCKLIHSYMLE